MIDLLIGQRSKTFLSRKSFSKAAWKLQLATCCMCVRERRRLVEVCPCPCGLSFRLPHSTSSCHAAKLTWKTHRTAELIRITVSGSTAKAFHLPTDILKRKRVSEAFRNEVHSDAALFKIWLCAYLFE